MRAAIYTRTSTRQQRTDIQLEALNTMVERSGWDLVDTIEDIGVSGGRRGETRDGMKKLMIRYTMSQQRGYMKTQLIERKLNN